MDQLWSASFRRFLNGSTDDRKLRVIQKVILHRLGTSSDYQVRMSDLLTASGSSFTSNDSENDESVSNASPKNNTSPLIDRSPETAKLDLPPKQLNNPDTTEADKNITRSPHHDQSLEMSLSNLFSSPKLTQPSDSSVKVQLENSKNIKISASGLYLHDKSNNTYVFSDCSENDSSKPTIDVKAKLIVSKNNIKLQVGNVSPPRKSTLKRNLPLGTRKRKSLSCIFQDNQQKPLSPISPKKQLNKSQPINLPESFADKVATKSVCLPPLMGMSAMLKKQNSRVWKSNSYESEIVSQLVLEKFRDILKRRRSFYKRYLRRKTGGEEEEAAESTSIQGSLTEPVEVEAEPEKWITTTDIEQQLEEDVDQDTSEDDQKFVSETDFLIQPQYNYPNSLCSPQEEKLRVSDEDLKFLLTTDDCNVDTSLTCDERPSANVTFDVETKSSDGYSTLDKIVDDEVEYDSQKFLREALGDYINISDGSEGRYSSVSKRLNENDRSYGTSDVSSLLSKTSTLYSKVLKKKKKNIYQSSVGTVYEELPPGSLCAEYFPIGSRAMHLIEQAAIQSQHIIQTSKALAWCKSIKEFASGLEEVELERLLLFTTCKREALMKEIRKVEYEEIKDLEPKQQGHVIISNLQTAMRGPKLLYQRHGNGFNEWFVCILVQDETVLASDAVQAYDGKIRFGKQFKLINLMSDFEIDIRFYSLNVKNKLRSYADASDMQLNKLCPNPKSLFQRSFSTRGSKQGYDTRRSSSFVFQGKLTIRVADLQTHITNFKLIRSCENSSLDRTVHMEIESGLCLLDKVSGFITMGSEAGGCATWSRRWCCLDDYRLTYWSYPSEEGVAEPIGSIDLRYCVTSSIQPADRILCAKPRTLLLEVGRIGSPNDTDSMTMLCKPSITIIRHYLALDCIEEVQMWQRTLNSAVNALRNWNLMKCQLYYKKY